MDRSRCNATAAAATDPDVTGRDNAADSATGSTGAAVRECADADTRCSAVAAIPGDNATRAVPAPGASCGCCSSCCCDRGRCCCGCCGPSRCYVETAAAASHPTAV